MFSKSWKKMYRLSIFTAFFHRLEKEWYGSRFIEKKFKTSQKYFWSHFYAIQIFFNPRDPFSMCR